MIVQSYLRLLLVWLLLLSTKTISYNVIQWAGFGFSVDDVTSIDWDNLNDRYITPFWSLGYIFHNTFANETADEYGNRNINGEAFNNTAKFTAHDPGSIVVPPIPTTHWRPTRGDVNNGKYYNVDMNEGRVAIFDLVTDKYVESRFIKTKDDTIANLNGICHDPDNPHMIYLTDNGLDLENDSWFASNDSWLDTGYEAVYSLNMNQDVMITNAVDIIYDKLTYVEGAANLLTYTIRAQDCVVNNGILYTIDDVGMSMYNIVEQKWSINTDVVGSRTGGDSLIYVRELNTFYTTSVESGTISKYNPIIDSKFEVVYEGVSMIGPSDITYSSDERLLATASVRTTFVNWIRVNDSLFTVTTTTETTTEITEITEMADDTATAIFTLSRLFCLCVALIV
eukprot:24387_1